jgi:ribonuclease P protein component
MGNAVKRNLIRRRLKALFYPQRLFLKSGFFVFIGKKEILDVDFLDLKFWFNKSLKVIKVLRGV